MFAKWFFYRLFFQFQARRPDDGTHVLQDVLRIGGRDIVGQDGLRYYV